MHIRCPHCRAPIEVVEQAVLSDLTCPTCGSNFSLVGNETTHTHQAKVRKVAHFDLLDQVGQGAFGIVWKAHDTVLGRTVALKIPRRGQVTPEEAEYFFRDARAAAQLSHPGIVQVYEVGRDGDTIFIASEFIAGATLAEWLEAHPLSPRESAELIAHVADAIEHAHQKGVVHRDLKPGNILIESAGTGSSSGRSTAPPPSNAAADPPTSLVPKITDFGLAKRDAGEITMTVDGQVLGTPAYMSPEQARGHGHQADARTDVYSLGVILYQLLTGELPFRGSKAMLVVQILNDEPPGPRNLNNRIPRDLETICLKAMARDPAKRYHTAQALAQDLGRFLSGQPILARPVGSLERAWRWAKRQPVVAGLLAAVIGALTLGVGASSFFAWKESQQRQSALQLANEKSFLASEKSQLALRNLELANAASQAAADAVRDRDASRKLQYAADMALCSQLWQSSDGTAHQIRDLLDSHRPAPGQADLREFTWRYQSSLLEGRARVFYPKQRPIALSVNRDGKLTVLQADSRVTTWSRDAAEPPQDSLLMPDKSHHAVALSRDGRHAALIDPQGNLTLIEVSSGTLRHRLGEVPSLRGVDFTADGRTLFAVGDDQTVRVWTVNDGQPQQEFNLPVQGVSAADLSNDRNTLLFARSTMVSLIVRTDAAPHALRDGSGGFVTYQGAVTGDGRLAAIGNAGGETRLWDTQSKMQIGSFRTSSAAFHLTFSSDGGTLAIGEKSGLITIWNTRSHALVQTLKGHDKTINLLRFSEDDRFLASADRGGAIRLWDLQREDSRKLNEAEVDGLAYSADGRWLAIGGPSGLRLRDRAAGDRPTTLDKVHTRSVAFSPDGAWLAAGGRGGDIRLWQIAPTRTQFLLQRPAAAVDEIGMLRFSADGKLLIAAYGRPHNFSGPGRSSVVALWDVADRTLRTTIQTDHEASALALSRDGRTLAIGTHGNDLELWNTQTWQRTARLSAVPFSAYASLVFSSDGKKLFAGNVAGGIEVWDVPRAAKLRTIPAHADCAFTLALSPDGQTLASGSWDRSIKLWHVDTERELRSVRAHWSWVYCVDFSPDGATLASGGVENSFYLQETTPRKDSLAPSP